MATFLYSKNGITSYDSPVDVYTQDAQGDYRYVNTFSSAQKASEAGHSGVQVDGRYQNLNQAANYTAQQGGYDANNQLKNPFTGQVFSNDTSANPINQAAASNNGATPGYVAPVEPGITDLSPIQRQATGATLSNPEAAAQEPANLAKAQAFVPTPDAKFQTFQQSFNGQAGAPQAPLPAGVANPNTQPVQPVQQPAPQQQAQPQAQPVQPQAQPVQQQAQAQAQPTVQAPSVNLQPGQSGDDVSQLQKWLISQGEVIPSIANGTAQYGYFGPETKAALASWQQKRGVDVAGNPGYFGPRTMAAIQTQSSSVGSLPLPPEQMSDALPQYETPTMASPVQLANDYLKQYGLSLDDGFEQQSPMQSFQDIYAGVYKSMGLDSLRQSYDDVNKQLLDLQNKQSDEISDLRDNPWLSQGVLDGKIKGIERKYEGRLENLLSFLKLREVELNNGREQAQFVTSNTLSQLQNQQAFDEQRRVLAIELAEKYISSLSPVEAKHSPAWTEWQDAVASGYKGTFVDYQNDDANRKIKIAKAGVAGGEDFGLSSITGKPLTDAERTASGFATRLVESDAIIDQIGSQFVGASSYAGQYAPNILKSADRQKFEQAKRNFVNAVLRRESGAVISDAEFANADKQYFPQPGDTASVLAQKDANRATVIKNLQLSGGQAQIVAEGTGVSKGKLRDKEFVEKSLNNLGISYQSAINGAQKGEIAVLDNRTGGLGYITPAEFNSNLYTKL